VSLVLPLALQLLQQQQLQDDDHDGCNMEPGGCYSYCSCAKDDNDGFLAPKKNNEASMPASGMRSRHAYLDGNFQLIV